MPDVEREEAITVGAFAAFGTFWVVLAVPYLTSAPWFVNLNPISGYLLYNLGWIALVSAIFGGLVSFLAFEEHHILGMIRVGFASWLFASLIFDNLQPPFYLSTSGQVLIPLGTPALENTAVDAMLGYVWFHILGASAEIHVLGIALVFITTYMLTPIIAIILMALLLAPDKFIDLFEGSLI